MTKLRNRIFSSLIQHFLVIPTTLYNILSTLFLFFAIAQFFSTFIEDVKELIKKLDRLDRFKLGGGFVEMIYLHRTSLK